MVEKTTKSPFPAKTRCRQYLIVSSLLTNDTERMSDLFRIVTPHFNKINRRQINQPPNDYPTISAHVKSLLMGYKFCSFIGSALIQAVATFSQINQKRTIFHPRTSNYKHEGHI